MPSTLRCNFASLDATQTEQVTEANQKHITLLSKEQEGCCACDGRRMEVSNDNIGRSTGQTMNSPSRNEDSAGVGWTSSTYGE